MACGISPSALLDSTDDSDHDQDHSHDTADDDAGDGSRTESFCPRGAFSRSLGDALDGVLVVHEGHREALDGEVGQRRALELVEQVTGPCLVDGRYHAADDGGAVGDAGDEDVVVLDFQDVHQGPNQHLRLHVAEEGVVVVVQFVREGQVELFPASEVDQLHAWVTLTAGTCMEFASLAIFITFNAVIRIVPEFLLPEIANRTNITVIGIIAYPAFFMTFHTSCPVEVEPFNAFIADAIFAGGAALDGAGHAEVVGWVSFSSSQALSAVGVAGEVK